MSKSRAPRGPSLMLDAAAAFLRRLSAPALWALCACCIACAATGGPAPAPLAPDALAVVSSTTATPYGGPAAAAKLSDEIVSQNRFLLTRAELNALTRSLVTETKRSRLFNTVFASTAADLDLYRPALMLRLTARWHVEGTSIAPTAPTVGRPRAARGVLYQLELVDRQSGQAVYRHDSFAEARRDGRLQLLQPLLTEKDTEALRRWHADSIKSRQKE